MRKFITGLAVGLITLCGASAWAGTMSALTSMETQVAKDANTPYGIVVTGGASPSYKIEGSKVTILRGGNYMLNAASQVGGSTTGEVYMWMRVNGKDVPESNSVQSVTSKSFTAVLVAQTGMTLNMGDVVEFVYAASAPGLGLIASRPAGMPGVPSIIFTILEM